MRELLTEEKVILEKLSERWSLGLYDLYESESLSVAQIAQFVKLYEEKGYIVRFKYRIIKTLKGYIVIKRLVPHLYCSSDTSWKQAPTEFFKKPLKRNGLFKNSTYKDFK